VHSAGAKLATAAAIVRAIFAIFVFWAKKVGDCKFFVGLYFS